MMFSVQHLQILRVISKDFFCLAIPAVSRWTTSSFMEQESNRIQCSIEKTWLANQEQHEKDRKC